MTKPRHATIRERTRVSFYTVARHHVCDLLGIEEPAMIVTRLDADGGAQILLTVDGAPGAGVIDLPICEESTDMSLYATAYACRQLWQTQSGYRGMPHHDATAWAKAYLLYAQGKGPTP